MSNLKLSVVLPAYEEAENLKILLPRINSSLDHLNYEVLVIDTQSPLDATSQVCSSNNAYCIPREGGDTFGDAVRTGIKSAKGEYIVFMDADCSHDPEFINNLMEYSEEYDVVIASRYIEDGQSDNNLVLRVMSKILNFTYALILNIPCKDVSNSFKVYHASSIKSISLYCNNFDIVEEILFKLSKSKINFKIKEIPFNFKKREHGTTKRNLFNFVFTYLITIIKLRFGK